MKPKPETIQRALRKLRRECIEQNDDWLLGRIAYAMECAVRWATEDTEGWESLPQHARHMAAIARAEIKESQP